jgi:uncharacterized protein (DUF433 family)
MKEPETKWATRIVEVITIDRDIMSGQPTLSGTRMPISMILATLAEGKSCDEFSDDHDIPRDEVRRLLMALARQWSGKL